MAIAFHCPHCDHFYRVKPEFSGEVWGCRACGGAMQVPEVFESDFDAAWDHEDMLPAEALVAPTDSSNALESTSTQLAMDDADQHSDEHQHNPFERSGEEPRVTRPVTPRTGNPFQPQAPAAKPRGMGLCMMALASIPLCFALVGLVVGVIVFVRSLGDLNQMSLGKRSEEERGWTVAALLLTTPQAMFAAGMLLVGIVALIAG